MVEILIFLLKWIAIFAVGLGVSFIVGSLLGAIAVIVVSFYETIKEMMG